MAKDTRIYINVPFKNESGSIAMAETSIALNPPVFLEPDSPQNYNLAIIRFEADLSAVPILVFEDNAYKITMGYDTAYVTQTLTFIPQVQNAVSLRNRYVYNIAQMVNILNVSFLNCYNALKVLKPACPALEPPQVVYNPITNKMSLITPIVGYDYSAAGSYPDNAITSIYVNEACNRFFDGCLFVKMNPLPYTNCDYLINQFASISNRTDAVGNPSASGTYISNIDETGIRSWFDISTINLESQQIGTRPEVVNGNQASQNPVKRIVTDFAIAPGNNEFRSGILYLPTSEYRRVNITRSTPLTTIDFALSWTAKDGTIRPVYLDDGGSFSVKILFERKQE